MSMALWAYSYGTSSGNVTGSLTVLSYDVHIMNSSMFDCVSFSYSLEISSGTLSFGGALATIYQAYEHPTSTSNTAIVVLQSADLTIARCNISNSVSASSSCSPGASNAAGGALFVSILSSNLVISSSFISNSSVRTGCAASSSETYSVGGGVSVFQASAVLIKSTQVMSCFAIGVPQAINVFVSGGGIFVQNSALFALENSSITSSGVEAAFSDRVLACGGGALATRNVPAIRISNSTMYNNSDSSSTAVTFLQQLNLESGMVVNITDGSVLSTNPSIRTDLPALNISCGFQCSEEHQKRLHLNVLNSALVAQNKLDKPYASAMVMSLPRWSLLSATSSFVNCSFMGADNIAVLVVLEANRSVLVTCSSCFRPFSIALASSSVNLSKVPSFVAASVTQDSCRSLALTSSISTSDREQQCPFGFSFCSTIANITVGYWAKFASDGSIGDAVRCPSNYCGCRNILGYSKPTCQLFPPFAVEFQPDDALCTGNRTGVMCGGCTVNFTQSLNGRTCVPNQICLDSLPWVWAITVVGYFMYSVYVVKTSMKKNSGLIMCVLFYGQLSSFAGVPVQLDNASQQSENSNWFSTVSQFGSILALYDNSCYGVNMGAYEATAAELCGPAIVLAASLLLAATAKHLLPRFTDFLQKHKIDVKISFGATVIYVLLLLYSSMAKVVFELITCQDVGSDRVVFIDGTKKCEGTLHEFLIAVAALLSIAPFVFWAALKFNKIPHTAKSAVCSAYSDSRYYWGAMSLLFRFVMTVVFATVRTFPSIAALALLMCSVCMFGLLIMLRPYAKQRTFYMDVFCNTCLIVQFSLQVLVRVSESLGVAVATTNSFRPTLLNAARASEVLR